MSPARCWRSTADHSRPARSSPCPTHCLHPPADRMALADKGLADRFPAERVGHGAPADLVAQRAGLDAAVQSGLWPCDPAPVERRVAGIRCLEFLPAVSPRGTVLHFLGGAFRLGRPEQVAPF